MPLRQIRRVGGQLVGDNAHFHIVPVGQTKMFLGRDVAEHRRAVPADLCRADATGDMVIAGRNIGDEGPKRVERRFAAGFQLLFHVLLDLVHGHVARPFDHHLHVLLPGALREFAQRVQLCKLRFVVGVRDGAGAQAITQRIGDVVGLHDLGNLVEAFVEEALLVVRQAPFRHNGTAARDDTGHALGRHRHIGQANAGMDGEIVDALLRLLDQRVAKDFPVEVLCHAADLFQRLIDRHGADGHRAVADDPFAGVVDVAARGKVHHGIRAPADGPDHLVHLVRHVRCDGGVADVGVDLHQEVAPDGHWLGFRMVDVGGDDGTSARHLVAHEFGRYVVGNLRAPAFAAVTVHLPERGAAKVLSLCHVFHLGRDDALPGVMHLRKVLACLGAVHRLAHVGIGRYAAAAIGAKLSVVLGLYRARFVFFDIAARQLPVAAQLRQACGDIDLHIGVGVGAGGIVYAYRRLPAGGFEVDLAHGYLDGRIAVGFDVHLAAAADGAGGDANFELRVDVGHNEVLSTGRWGNSGLRHALPERATALPSARANGFRFNGSCGAYPHLSAIARSPGMHIV